MSTQTESVELVGEEVAANVARAALFAALTGAFAYVSFPNPVSPVEITLQVLAVFLAGIFLGPVWGGASLTLYLAAGALGAPVFSQGTAGVAPLLGPTAGYLWSFPLAALATGFVVHGGTSLRDPSAVGVGRLVAGMVAGTVVIYLLGTLWLSWSNNLGLVEAFLLGSVAFLPFEALKMAAAVGVVRSEAVRAR
ncbi:biotin transporter BioY [Halobacteriaceae archaeon GCM10025711]